MTVPTVPTQLDRIESLLLDIFAILGAMVTSDDDEPEQLTLDGQPAGVARDTSQSLG